MSLLPISQEDLATCAERWGLHYNETFNCIGSFNASCNDEHNAAAILDRITHLTRNGGSVAIFADLLGFSWWDKGQARHVDVPAPTDEAPNLLSWLLVELTKQLPPEVWK